MQKTIAIYQSTFGFKCMKVKHSVPVEVGASKRSNFLYENRDNCGKNISDSNDYFGELTGLYWIWKNCKHEPCDIIGFCHYNKVFSKDVDVIADELLASKYEWVVTSERKMPPHDDLREWRIYMEVLKEKYYDYYRAFQEIYNSDGSSKACNSSNMFITTWHELDDYCSILFEVLFNVREAIGNSEKNKYDKRYCAFFGERFLTAYLLQNKKNHTSVDIKYNKQYILYLKRFAKFLPVSNNSRLYSFIKRKILNNSFVSSYRREE